VKSYHVEITTWQGRSEIIDGPHVLAEFESLDELEAYLFVQREDTGGYYDSEYFEVTHDGPNAVCDESELYMVEEEPLVSPD
jgi:hypothetical protein